MTIVIASHRLSEKSLQERYSDAHILDLTSNGPEPWVRFSPFYPHGDIPVPFSPGYNSASVEGIWQGLKVFTTMDVDISKFAITTMKNIKRSTRKYGQVQGHRRGVHGEQLLSYLEARKAIYVPTYRWALDHRLQDLLAQLQHLATDKTIVFLDYETNCDINDVRHPLSHVGLVKRYLENEWPE